MDWDDFSGIRINPVTGKKQYKGHKKWYNSKEKASKSRANYMDKYGSLGIGEFLENLDKKHRIGR